jgi:predicted phosphodiesterase
MTRLALISDIHGNCVGLDAVLADATVHGADEIVCLGDVAAGGPQPREAIRRLREVGCPTVRGNADGWLLEGLPPGRSDATRRLGEAVAWAHEQLATEDLDYLAALPPTLAASAAGVSLLCFHGSPRSDIDSLLATTPELELNELFAGAAEAHVFAGGHTHLQLLRPYRQSLLINPGSVGLPLSSLMSSPGGMTLPSWAEYALIEVDRGDVEISFRRVSVDVAPLAAATAAMPHSTWAVDLAQRLERWNARAVA